MITRYLEFRISKNGTNIKQGRHGRLFAIKCCKVGNGTKETTKEMLSFHHQTTPLGLKERISKVVIQDRWVTAAEDIGWSDFLVAGKGGLDALCDKVKERNALEEKFEELLSPILQEMSLLKNGVIVYTPKKNTGPVLVQLFPQNMYYPVEAGKVDRQTKVRKLGDGLYVYTPSKEYLSRNRRDTMQFEMLDGKTTSLVPPGGGAKIEATVYSLRLVQ